MLIGWLLGVGLALAGECDSPEASTSFEQGYAAQQEARSTIALAAYEQCLKLEPSCVACQYEQGWSYWSRSDWKSTVDAWEKALKLDPEHKSSQTWLPQARDKAAGKATRHAPAGLRVPIGTRSTGSERVQLQLAARFQNYNATPSADMDHFDEDVYSPKSARFSADGSKVYVNSLEGFVTVVYDAKTRLKRQTIRHEFGAKDAALFKGESSIFGYPYYRKSPAGDPNQFKGKPVESALSHQGRYLWVPYYRRDFDVGATSPSAVAVIDTATDTIVRMLPTGPIPKYVVASPDNRWMVVTHWGDNTLGVIDISSGDPATFKYRPERLVVERALPQTGLAGHNRDSACGFCLRGTAFSPDGKTLLVARMGDGGIAGFDVESWSYLGTVTGEKPTPRHLVPSADGRWLYLSSNRSGYVSKISLEGVVTALRGAGGASVVIEGWQSVYVGGGARTIALSPDEKIIFSAVNGRAELVAVDAETLEVLSRVRTDSYTVGLGVSPDGKQVWTTSQGKSGKGGNSVCVYDVRFGEGDP
jgi:DNA-binding beta-propeller fold protein YncE